MKRVPGTAALPEEGPIHGAAVDDRAARPAAAREPGVGERAFLVAVAFTGTGAKAAGRKVRRTAALARDAALLRADPALGADGEPASSSLTVGEGEIASGAAMDAEASIAEFRELVQSAGGAIVGEMAQRRPRPDPATLLGSGKVEELAGAAAAANADLILFDHDLSPTQLRNLEDALPCPVVDRTQLILDIFARHARTREGQLQVELAQLEYMLPRLTGRGRAMSQLGGGIGTRGPGETQLETDRRRISRRLVLLRRELDAVRRVRRQQRQRRETAPVPTVALVGYTNAGKSTLFNRLTDADVFASSQMFATLDPKLRAILLPSRRKVLLSDTVGFIRDLPHTLVTSFRATLEEVEKAEVLLHVQDASHPQAAEHKGEVEKVLGELGVLDKPRIEVWNKVDLLGEAQGASVLADGVRGARGIAVSALRGTGIAELLVALDMELVGDPVEERWLRVPQSAGEVLAALDAGALIKERRFEGEEAVLAVAGPRSLLGRFRRFWVTNAGEQGSPSPGGGPTATDI